MTLGEALAQWSDAHPGLLESMQGQVEALLRAVPDPTLEQYAAAVAYTMGGLFMRYVDDEAMQQALLVGFLELLHRMECNEGCFEGQGDA